MKTKEFKMRASKAGILLTRGGAESKTVQTELQQLYKESVYGQTRELKSKYLDKGVLMEDKAIDATIEHLNLPFKLKNEKQFENEYFTGMPDLIFEEEKLTVDTKCSWDWTTFPLFERFFKENGEPYSTFYRYYAQGQVYMELTGCRYHKVVFVLLNTPENLEPWKEQIDYADVAMKYRIREVTFPYSEDVIQVLQDEVKNCRTYLHELEDELNIIE